MCLVELVKVCANWPRYYGYKTKNEKEQIKVLLKLITISFSESGEMKTDHKNYIYGNLNFSK